MKLTIRISLFFTSLLFSIIGNTNGLVDALKFKSTNQEAKNIVAPYTIYEIIQKIPLILNQETAYDGNTPAFKNDERFTAYNELNYGKCEQLYITKSSYGGVFIANTVKFAFAKNDTIKEDASRRIKNAFNAIQDTRGDLSGYPVCKDKQLDKAIRLKELANAIITAAPAIVSEKNQKTTNSDKPSTISTTVIESKDKREEKSDRQRKNREEAPARAEAERLEMQRIEQTKNQERQKNELSERQHKETQQQKAKVCFDSAAFKLHTSAYLLINVRTQRISAKRAMDNEQNAAKISGFIDKTKMYEYGKIITNSDSYISENFSNYKKLGGKAENINDLQPLTNPCENMW